MKGQSNPEISRSPRNSFRASPGRFPAAVEHWTEEGASPPTDADQTPNADGTRRPGVRACGLSCVLERETAQTAR